MKREDAPEEPKEFWFINFDGEIFSKEYEWFNQNQDDIGNRFETEEKTEKAVEKLKAYKKLFDLKKEVDANISFSVMCSDEKVRKLIIDYLRIIFDMKG